MSNFNPLIEKITNFAQTYEAAGDTLQEARICFYDSLACAFLALEHSQAQNFCALPYIKNSSGSVGVIGTDIKTNVIDATLLNGALIRWLDFNDTWLAKEWGHPSDNLSTILALTDYLDKEQNKKFTFKDILNFMVIAHEIQGSLAIENSFNKVGLDHVLLVKIASAAVASKMLGHDYIQMSSVISNSFLDGQSLRTYRHFPNTGARKSWAAGDAASKGLKQAFISEVSDEGYPTAITAKVWGFNDVLMRDNPLKLERNLNSYVMDNILYKVNFPAEFHAQTAAEAAIKLSKKLSGKIDEITKIEIQTQEPGVRIISKKGPLKNYADRDHCIEYIVAWCLINGSLDANSYDDVSASNPKIDQLRDLTSTHENQSYTNRYYDLAERAIPNSVTVKLGSGEIFTEEVIYPLGHRNRREESKPFLGAKFEKSLKKSNLDKSFLLDAYKNEAIDKVEIYDILTKIYK
ncbi:MAG: 2-methylcitrate dehydratase [SAR86 cluster bacterium]|nr:2-methylcitrate dehydratase [SAR86 cluster bacterium]|tara:strand:+ start:2185 stop:3573 length:1389 start_codon:yes stop_codon:yes gene_type:complete